MEDLELVRMNNLRLQVFFGLVTDGGVWKSMEIDGRYGIRESD